MAMNGQGGAPLIWLLIDGRAGNESQCRGVADALRLQMGYRIQVQDLEYNAKGALPNFIIGASFGGLTASSRVNLVPPWPDLVIAAGRRSAPVARNIKASNGGRTFLAQIMYPGDAGTDEFDLIAVPSHDRFPGGPNVLRITGAPHRVTERTLAAAKGDWSERLEHLPAPRIALIVGGSTKRRTFTEAMAAELGGMANAMAADAGGSLMVTTSRRTGDGPADALASQLTVAHVMYRWGRGSSDSGQAFDENPYMGYLAMADGVVVTGDSVSMCSEACATEGPVYIFAPKKATTLKHGRLHRELFDAGHARPFEGKFEAWSHPRLNAAGQIADEIRRRMGF